MVTRLPTGFRCLNPENLRKTELPGQANHGVIHEKPAIHHPKMGRIILKNLSQTQTSVRKTTRSQLLASFADHQSYDVAPVMANPLLSTPLISYRPPSVKVSQGFGVASDAFSNLRHLSFGKRSHHDANKRGTGKK